jgi:hypothetical protein
MCNRKKEMLPTGWAVDSDGKVKYCQLTERIYDLNVTK